MFMNRIHSKKIKYMIISAIALLVFGTTVAFATLSKTLNITGAIDRIGGTWEIYFSNISATTNSPTAKSHSAVISETDRSKINISASFTEPGDCVTYDFTITNGGTVDAILQMYEVGNIVADSGNTAGDISSSFSSNLIYKDNGNNLMAGIDKLPKETSEDVELEICYNGQHAITEDQFFSFEAKIQYIQD